MPVSWFRPLRTRAIGALLLAALPLATLPAATLLAATFPEETPFNQNAFEADQKADRPILVHITASWCTTCAAQKPIVDKLLAEPRFKNMAVFNINFDDQKNLVHRFKANMQSTLIVYKGGKEEGRSVGDTNPKGIALLLGKAV